MLWSRSLDNLVKLVLEVERTFRIRRQYQKRKKAQESQPSIMDNNNRTSKDFTAANAQELHSSIARPTIEENNFELKQALQSMV